MSDTWYKKLGFYNNPFSIKPAAFQEDLIAYDMDYIYSKIENGEMLFIEGEYGTGKTTILKNIISKFRGKNKIIYYSFNAGENRFEINELLDGANSVLRRVTGFRQKNIILLLDEVHSMTTQDAKRIVKPFKDGTIRSVIFVSHDYEMVKFPEEYSTFLNGNVLRTVYLSNSEAIDLVKKRIGKLDMLPERIISKIYSLSDRNPRRLLENCEDVLRYAVEIGEEAVSERHLNEVIGVAKKHVKKHKEEPAPVQEIVTEQPVEQPAVEPEKKKFKINKLVGDEKKNTLGTIAEKEEVPEETKDDSPEYKIYFLDKEE